MLNFIVFTSLLFVESDGVHPFTDPSISTDHNETQLSANHVHIPCALSIYRDHFSLYDSRKTPHSSPVRASYGVSFTSANLTEVSSL